MDLMKQCLSIITKVVKKLKMNYLAASCRGINIEFLFYRCKHRSIKLIYPDTLRYRDSFNLQISMHSVFEI